MPNTNKPVTGFHTNPERRNLNGRPKREWTVAGLIEEALEEQDTDGVSYKIKVTDKLRQLALRGDMNAIKEINQRLDGMPVQKNVLAGDEDSPLRIDISVTLDKVYGQEDKTSAGEMHTDSKDSGSTA